ncbi:hypothetical protein [Natrialba aegyptia]|uniref:NAD-dependent epimerase/dehydratase n=2 Tax=Natrialba aegyptia TaxID=129789 RepID=M0BAH7_9EURY|nr:NAD-dependent epimerase/dehydratase [Natrialba aegyptia DSM 13077]
MPSSTSPAFPGWPKRNAALAADIDGHEASHAMAADNHLGRPTANVIETVFGARPAEGDLAGEESAFSTAKATTELGWESTHTRRDAETELGDGPSFIDS